MQSGYIYGQLKLHKAQLKMNIKRLFIWFYDNLSFWLCLGLIMQYNIV